MSTDFCSNEDLCIIEEDPLKDLFNYQNYSEAKQCLTLTSNTAFKIYELRKDLLIKWRSIVGMITKNRFKTTVVFENAQAAYTAAKTGNFYFNGNLIRISSNFSWKYRIEINDLVQLAHFRENVHVLNPTKISREICDGIATQNVVIETKNLLSKHEKSLFTDLNDETMKGRLKLLNPTNQIYKEINKNNPKKNKELDMNETKNSTEDFNKVSKNEVNATNENDTVNEENNKQDTVMTQKNNNNVIKVNSSSEESYSSYEVVSEINQPTTKTMKRVRKKKKKEI